MMKTNLYACSEGAALCFVSVPRGRSGDTPPLACDSTWPWAPVRSAGGGRPAAVSGGASKLAVFRHSTIPQSSAWSFDIRMYLNL